MVLGSCFLESIIGPSGSDPRCFAGIPGPLDPPQRAAKRGRSWNCNHVSLRFALPRAKYLIRAWDKSESMGLFKVRVRVFNLAQEQHGKEVELVVDTGATYPVIPRTLADELGIRPMEERTFTLADGSRLSRQMGWAGLSYDGRKMPSLVVLGEMEDIPLLGALALEGLGFEVDPVTKTLRPATQFLL